MKTLEITEKASITYAIRNIPEGGWADITIREWEGGGSFYCQSDYGDYAYTWGSIGERTFKEFLCQLDKDYFLKKTRSQDFMIFDSDGTFQGLKEDTLRYRREHDLTKEDARECWDAIEEMEAYGCSSEDEFWHRFSDTCLVDKLYCGDYSGAATRRVYNPMCDMFWERVWPRITEYWKRTSASGKEENNGQ